MVKSTLFREAYRRVTKFYDTNPVIQMVDSSNHSISDNLPDESIGFGSTYPNDSNLSIG